MTSKLIIEGHKEKDIFLMKEIANRLKNSGGIGTACMPLHPSGIFICM
jgi:hypothetical protein